MLADGYASASSRRVAKEAGVNSALVFYYFDSLDGMFVELFKRGAEQSYARLERALASPQPLWGFWELIHDASNSTLTMEFMALANHRKAVREEIADYSRRFRKTQLDALTPVLEGYGYSTDRAPASVLILGMASLSRFMLIEEAFGVDMGHAEVEESILDFIRSLEGDRRTEPEGGDAAPPPA